MGARKELNRYNELTTETCALRVTNYSDEDLSSTSNRLDVKEENN